MSQDRTGASGSGVSVCVPSTRGGTVTAAITSIRRQQSRAWELVVVMQGDDAQLRREVDLAERADERIRGVWIPGRGVSRARNAAAAAAVAYPTLAFLDDDCEAAPDWLARIEAAIDADPSVGVVAGSLVAPPRTGWRPSRTPSSIPLDFTLRPPLDGPLPRGSSFVTASCAVRRWAWEEIGPFDEELGAGTGFRGGEDLDFFLRAAQRVPIRFLPDATVHHTYGTRHGIRAVHDISVAYASGQGAVAAKLSLGPGGGDEWRRAVREDCLVRPLRRFRPLGAALRLPRLWAFERSYQRCLRRFQLDSAGLLERRSGVDGVTVGVAP